MNMATKKAAIVLVAGLAMGLSAAAEPLETVPAPVGVEQSVHEHVLQMIAAQTFFSLPTADQAKIRQQAEIKGIDLPFEQGEALPETNPNILARSAPLSEEEFTKAYEAVKDQVELDEFKSFKPIHQRMLASFSHIVETKANGGVPVMPCFAPGTDPKLIAAFEAILFAGVDQNGDRFQQTSRWTSTAMDPGGGGQGNPTILTYSFPDDGTTVPNGVGEGTGPNGLNAFMDGIYGNRATWRALYDQMFARWGELSGNTYVLEPNDDNSTLFNNPGVVGVRGDLRMSGKPIDGNSGILAYNFFPQNGDMVIDAPDNFYNNTTQQSRRLRNVLAHEHGHGQGQLHVCPSSGTKLMEPFISTAYDGPQFDDTLNTQRHYGDPVEPNDSTGTAVNLGSFNVGDSVSVGDNGAANGSGFTDFVSIDDNSDSDYYLMTLNSSGSITATVTPRGFTYNEGPQPGGGGCDNGSPGYNPLAFNDLGIQVLDAGGNVIQSVNDNPAGQAETVVANSGAGAAYVRVFGGSSNTIQAYTLSIDVGQGVQIPLDFSVIGTPPSLIAPSTPTSFTALLTINDDTLIGTPTVNYQRVGDGGFTTVNMTGGAGGVYTANLPGFDCGDDPVYFVSAEGVLAGVVTDPDVGNFSATIGTGTSTLDDGETNIGWTVSGNATAGQWVRGVPQNNGRSDPPADFDGSGQCWQTGLIAGNSNSDVDGGQTIMTSPLFDFSTGGTVSYAYWMDDVTNPIGAEDFFRVEVSTDGGSTWAIARNYSSQSAWRTDSIDIGAEFGATSTLRIRFVAADNDPGDVLECAVDAINFTSISCDAGVCLPDVNHDGQVTAADFTAWVAAFNAGDPECDQNLDGLCTAADFTAWVANFNAGCP
ncbi:MAG TPA: matrixin family metalloprotease [Phycisphaerales bacterium]|nr:matrixin family metalloprotease [Phycisphaerales bacterium]